MLLSLLLGMPIWAMLLSYFFTGLLWALCYGHYRLRSNATKYAKWRASRAALLDGDGKNVKGFFLQREQALSDFVFFDLTGFMVRVGMYFSSWPLSMAIAVLCEVLIPLLKKLWKVLTNLHRYIRKALSAMYQVMSRYFAFIIARENREAIADMAVLNQGKGDQA